MDETQNQTLQPEGPSNLASLDWERSSAVDVRKQLAKHFEHFLIDNMNAGRVEPASAQDTASLFVKIFESASTKESLNSALDTLSHEKNALLQGFFLRVEEMRRRQISSKLYDFMDYLVKKNEIALARHLFEMYSQGQIVSTQQMEQLQSKFTIETQVNQLKTQLESKGLTQQVQTLIDAFTNNRIQSETDLAPWQAIVVGTATSPDTKRIVTTAIATQSEKRTIYDRLVTFDTRLRQLGRKIVGKN